MNFENACNILNLSHTFTEKELRKSYLVASLKYHPDKNKSEEATFIFQNIGDAYYFLNNGTSQKDHIYKTSYDSYSDIMEHFISLMTTQYKNITQKDDFDDLIYNFKNKCTNLSLKMIEKLNKENIIRLYEYIYLYGDLLNINEDMLDKIRIIIQEKMRNDSVVILNPNIKNLLENDIYKLEYENYIVYVPLWIRESVFDLSNGNIYECDGCGKNSNTYITIKCIPDLSDNISIDDANNIHVKVYAEINNILVNNISINLGEKVFEIPSDKLLIKKYQTYTIKNKGIATLHTNLDISHYNDIIIHIYLL